MSNSARTALCIVRAATPRLRPLQLLLADCIDLLQLLLPIFVRFSCCSPIASICFNCCSPFLSASAAARHLCLLQLLLPDCVHFNCSPIASVAPRLRPLQLLLRLHLQLPDCVRFDCCIVAKSNFLVERCPPKQARVQSQKIYTLLWSKNIITTPYMDIIAIITVCHLLAMVPLSIDERSKVMSESESQTP